MHFLVSVDVHPGVLGIARAAEFGLSRRADKAEVVIGRRIDQVTEFLLWETTSPARRV